MSGDNARLLAAVGNDAEEPPPPQLLALLERILTTTGWFWKTNAEGRTTFVSSAYAALSGMQPSEVLGKNEWVQGRNLKAAMARRMATAAGQRAEFSEIEFQQMRGADLDPIWCVTSGVPVWDEQGAFRGYWGVTRVVTERKRVEQRLQASEARYRQLADATSDWVWSTNERHEVSELSAAQRIAKTDTLGRCRWDLADAQLPENDWPGHRTVLDARLPFRDFEFARQDEGGTQRWISISGAPRFDGAGVFLGYQGTGRYVTERKRAELQLARSEARYRRLATLSADWEWSSDAEHRFTFFSERAINLSVSTPGQGHGRTRWELEGTFPEHPEWEEHRRQLAAREPIRDFEYPRTSTIPPRVRWTSVSGDPVFAADGAFLGYEGTARDITAKKQAQLRLRYLSRMYAALSDVERDVSDLDDVEEAIAAVCRLTYEVGGLARVIYFAHDKAAAALVVTHYAGSDVSAIARLNLTMREDNQDATLPVVLAAIERRPQISQDYCGDPRVARFHDLARLRGINASLALPVCVQGRLIGVLGLYAREMDWFDDELVVLSERIVASLAQAIDSIESRSAKRAAELAHARVQRFYATLGEVGETALRSRSAEELLAATCRVLHETGGLVGVSYYQADELNQELLLAAGAGASTPAKMDLAADGTDPAGHRPSFRAWFTRTTVVANDYLSLESTRKFHDYYRARGVEASMITPVPGEGAHCHGLLALMAASRHWFDAELVDLSERIAVVLGQALSRLALEHSKAAAETELARSEARYRQFAALASDWHWESDADHRFTHMSGNLSAHKEQQLGDRVGQIICSAPCTPEPEQLVRYRAMLDAHGPIRDLLLHITGLPLRPWWRVNAAPRFDAQGTFLGYSGATRDVTPEIAAELARRQAEDHFNRLARLSVDWYWQTDAQGRITHVSESYTRMTGMPLSDVQGLVAFQAGPADDSEDERAQGERAIAAMVTARQPFYDKVYLRSQKVAPGQEEWRITSGEPVFGADGVFLGYRGTARAISAPERSEDKGQQ